MDLLQLGICLLLCVQLCHCQIDLQNELSKQKDVVAELARQVMLQQLSAEEKIRSDGDSGIKQVRLHRTGPRPYYGNTFTGDAMASIHDHANFYNVLGQGEVNYVLNGIEFMTRHNDYLLNMPSKSSTTYNKVEDVPHPPVPPEVTSKPSVQEEVEEMREWFKAWKEQNYTVRDYRPYFRPALCYLEGAWTTVISENVEEPFYSERHKVEANTWYELQEKIRFTTYTGTKNRKENLAWLPRILMNVTETGELVYGQWNYRQLCHPLKEDLPTEYLKVVDDVGARLPRGLELEEFEKTRAARFNVIGPNDDQFTTYSLLDELMSEVPGKDNYPADLQDTTMNYNILDPVFSGDKLMNVGYYHRRYKLGRNDAMGLTFLRRGFNDEAVFMAETSQPRIAPIFSQKCNKLGDCYGSLKRMSYAVPLEIVYLTPLANWNPYDLEYKSSKRFVSKNGRNGAFTPEKAYDGTANSVFYRTPSEFFTGGEILTAPADSVKDSVGILDKQGNIRAVSASGPRIFMPRIPGIGILRQRYPIVPVHGEGSAVWKELNAVKDILMRLSSHQRFLYENISLPSADGEDSGPVRLYTYTTSTAFSNPPGPHSHTVEFTQDELSQMRQGQTVEVTTSENNGHSHSIKVRFGNNRFYIDLCDDNALPCWDGHTSCLMAELENSCSNM